MIAYVIVSIASGLLFGILDGVINANPLARRLFQVYDPIARKSINPIAGMLIDLFFGFVMAGAFLILYTSLPGVNGWLKGLSFAALLWFFRVVMYVASQWIMFTVPLKTLVYLLLAGLVEAFALGSLYGLTLAGSAG